MIELDASYGEGGGQLVRMAAAFAALTGKGVDVGTAGSVTLVLQALLPCAHRDVAAAAVPAGAVRARAAGRALAGELPRRLTPVNTAGGRRRRLAAMLRRRFLFAVALARWNELR